MTPGPCQVHFHPLLLSRVQMKKAFQCLASHTPGSWSQQLLWGEDVHNCPFTSEKDASCPSDLAFICGCYKIWVHSRSALLHSGPLPDAVLLPRLPRWSRTCPARLSPGSWPTKVIKLFVVAKVINLAAGRLKHPRSMLSDMTFTRATLTIPAGSLLPLGTRGTASRQFY